MVLTMHGHEGSTSIALLQNSVAAMQINATLVGLTHDEDKMLQV
jgi:hypothetical protein